MTFKNKNYFLLPWFNKSVINLSISCVAVHETDAEIIETHWGRKHTVAVWMQCCLSVEGILWELGCVIHIMQTKVTWNTVRLIRGGTVYAVPMGNVVPHSEKTVSTTVSAEHPVCDSKNKGVKVPTFSKKKPTSGGVKQNDVLIPQQHGQSRISNEMAKKKQKQKYQE